MATHVVADEQATERNTPVPPSTVRDVQVVPPSVLTRIDAPTATQKVVVGHATDPIAPAVFGNVAALQLVPPLAESSNSPAKGPATPGDTPALTQSDVEGHETPSSVVFGVGIEIDVHSFPPSVDRTDAP